MSNNNSNFLSFLLLEYLQNRSVEAPLHIKLIILYSPELSVLRCGAAIFRFIFLLLLFAFQLPLLKKIIIINKVSGGQRVETTGGRPSYMHGGAAQPLKA